MLSMASARRLAKSQNLLEVSGLTYLMHGLGLTWKLGSSRIGASPGNLDNYYVKFTVLKGRVLRGRIPRHQGGMHELL